MDRTNRVIKALVLDYVDGTRSAKPVRRLYWVEADLFYSAVDLVVGIPVRDEDPPRQKES
jgi:hypothetical protein